MNDFDKAVQASLEQRVSELPTDPAVLMKLLEQRHLLELLAWDNCPEWVALQRSMSARSHELPPAEGEGFTDHWKGGRIMRVPESAPSSTAATLPPALEEFVVDVAREYGPEAAEGARVSAQAAWGRVSATLPLAAMGACKDIFNDFSVGEAKTQATSIRRAWEIGGQVIDATSDGRADAK